MSNVLIVESHNDQYFIQALLEHLELQQVKLNSPICAIDDYQCLNGLDKEKLRLALTRLKNQLLKPKDEVIGKIGIIIDLDQDTVENRLKLVNAAIQEVFATELAIPQVNHWITVPVDADVSVEISCYFMNVGGKGELETVLKAIKCKTSTHTDCLDKWRECVKTEHKLTDKAFDKFWIQVYQRFDCCDKKEKYQADENCNLQASLKKGAYDFDSPTLDTLKEFLMNVSTS